MKFKYSEIQPNQLEEASSLILRTYLEYNTDGLSDESIEEFKRLTTAEYFKEWLDWKDKLPKFFNMWVCTDEDTGKIVGVSVGYYDKLDNLFVDRRYHRKGIAKRLFEIMLEYFNPAKMRVFSSLYAQDFYRKLGFVDVVVPAGSNLVEFLDSLQNSSDFELVTFNIYGEFCSGFVPNDPQLSNQWYLGAINIFDA